MICPRAIPTDDLWPLRDTSASHSVDYVKMLFLIGKYGRRPSAPGRHFAVRCRSTFRYSGLQKIRNVLIASLLLTTCASASPVQKNDGIQDRGVGQHELACIPVFPCGTHSAAPLPTFSMIADCIPDRYTLQDTQRIPHGHDQRRKLQN